jgi:chromosome segregation ATPase
MIFGKTKKLKSELLDSKKERIELEKYLMEVTSKLSDKKKEVEELSRALIMAGDKYANSVEELRRLKKTNVKLELRNAFLESKGK